MEIFENDRVNCKNRIFIIFDFDYENEFSVELSIKLYYTILQSSEKNVGMQMKLRVIFSSQVINFIQKSQSLEYTVEPLKTDTPRDRPKCPS